MSAEQKSLVQRTLDLGAESFYLDRRSHIDLAASDDLFLVAHGSVVLFARPRAGGRRHRIGVIPPGAAFAGPAPGIEAVPVNEAELLRLRVGARDCVTAGSPTEQALCAAIAAGLAACGISSPSRAGLVTACTHGSTSLASRGSATIEVSFARHLRRLVSVAASRLAFPQELQSMLVDRPNRGRAHVPDTRLPPIVRACTQVALEIGADPSTIPTRIPRDNTRRPEQIFAHVAGLGIRPVFLDPGWWHSGVGSLLAFREEDHAPVAVIATASGMMAYVHSGGATIGPVRVDAAFAAQLTKNASQFHPTLSASKSSILQFLRFVVRGSERDFVHAFLISGLASLVNLAIPIATGVLVTRILPSDNGWGLFFLGSVLFATTLTAASCGFVVSNLLLRSESRMASRALSGVLDRCLRMPTQTFRSFTSGDLADRILSVGDLQTVISGAAISAIMAGAFSMMYVAVMLYVSTSAALIGCALLVLAVLFSVVLSALRSRLSSTILEGQGHLTTMALQFIGGIDTIRSAASEHYATLRWMGPFRETRVATMRIRTLERLFDAFATGFPMVCLMVFWIAFLPVDASGGVAQMGPGATERVAEYLMFNAAFVAALYSVLEFGEHLGDLSSLRSTLRRIAPILNAPTERTADREQPGVLGGKIDIDDVHFAYPGSANEVLGGVSLHIAAGESVAIVGSSGSGKSTLIQLILGMRRPTAGEVLFDDKALGRLDLVSVRRQIGAVVQNTRVVPGSILDNIIGSTLFTVKDAEASVEASGFDEEVGKMPMGLHTYVTDQTLSGGQVQKLMIARALVTRPRILIFDEATSALDEISQAQVVRSLESLQTTRIVVAHRLSTIRSADRIYVMELGRIVQVGTFEQLIAVGGPFQEMARRQLVDFNDETAI